MNCKPIDETAHKAICIAILEFVTASVAFVSSGSESSSRAGAPTMRSEEERRQIFSGHWSALSDAIGENGYKRILRWDFAKSAYTVLAVDKSTSCGDEQNVHQPSQPGKLERLKQFIQKKISWANGEMDATTKCIALLGSKEAAIDYEDIRNCIEEICELKHHPLLNGIAMAVKMYGVSDSGVYTLVVIKSYSMLRLGRPASSAKRRTRYEKSAATITTTTL